MNIIRKKAQSVPPALYMILLLVVVYGLLVNNYFVPKNFANILSQAAPLLVLACGQTLIVMLQGTELSLGSAMSVVTVLWIVLLNNGIPMIPSILITIIAAGLIGLLNGVLVAYGGLPIFIVTLGMQNILKSIALLLSDSSSVYYEHPIFRTVAKGTVLGLPLAVWLSFLCFGITWVLLRKTRFGTHVITLGGNPESLTLSGGSIRRSTICAFIYAGLMAGVAGFLLCCRIESGNPNSGNGFEFNSVAAVLLGGTSMREGRGGVGGTIFGVLLIQILKSGLNQVGISSIYQNAIIGTFVLSAIIFDAFLKRRVEA